MEIKYKYNEEDTIYNSNSYNVDHHKLLRYAKFYRLLLLLEIILFIILIIVFIKKLGTVQISLLSVGFILIIFSTYIKTKIFFNAYKTMDTNTEENTEVTIKLTDEGIEEFKHYQLVLYRWSKLKEVFINDKYIDIMMKNTSPLTIPLRVFKNEDELDKFLEVVNSYVKGDQIYKID